MKNIIIAILGIVIVLMTISDIIDNKEEKETKEKATAEKEERENQFVFVDSNGCLHKESWCFMVRENAPYAVKVYKKDDPNLSAKHEYICIHCCVPDYMEAKKSPFDEFK